MSTPVKLTAAQRNAAEHVAKFGFVGNVIGQSTRDAMVRRGLLEAFMPDDPRYAFTCWRLTDAGRAALKEAT